MPAFIVAETLEVFTVADVCANRCLAIATHIENKSAIDQTLLRGARALAGGTQALVDALSPGEQRDLGRKVARLHNALDMLDAPGQVAA